MLKKHPRTDTLIRIKIVHCLAFLATYFLNLVASSSIVICLFLISVTGLIKSKSSRNSRAFQCHLNLLFSNTITFEFVDFPIFFVCSTNCRIL